MTQGLQAKASLPGVRAQQLWGSEPDHEAARSREPDTQAGPERAIPKILDACHSPAKYRERSRWLSPTSTPASSTGVITGRPATSNFALLSIELLDPTEPGLSALVPVACTGSHALYRFTQFSYPCCAFVHHHKLALQRSPWTESESRETPDSNRCYNMAVSD